MSMSYKTVAFVYSIVSLHLHLLYVAKIVYPQNMVPCLRNNQALSLLGIEPVTESHKSSALILSLIHISSPRD